MSYSAEELATLHGAVPIPLHTVPHADPGLKALADASDEELRAPLWTFAPEDRRAVILARHRRSLIGAGDSWSMDPDLTAGWNDSDESALPGGDAAEDCTALAEMRPSAQ